jgi:hypothetical protein
MKIRVLAAVGVAGALALSHSGAQAAAVPVLDGKKTKKLSVTFTPAPQAHDSDFFTDSLKANADRTNCTAPRCGWLPFVFKPAKGVKGGVAFTLTWSAPGEDMDLYVVEVAKDGTSGGQLADCGAAAGSSERIQLSSSDFKPGKKYALLADFYRSTGGKVTATVAFPGTTPIKSTVPGPLDSVQSVNCGL